MDGTNIRISCETITSENMSMKNGAQKTLVSETEAPLISGNSDINIHKNENTYPPCDQTVLEQELEALLLSESEHCDAIKTSVSVSSAEFTSSIPQEPQLTEILPSERKTDAKDVTLSEHLSLGTAPEVKENAGRETTKVCSSSNAEKDFSTEDVEIGEKNKEPSEYPRDFTESAAPLSKEGCEDFEPLTVDAENFPSPEHKNYASNLTTSSDDGEVLTTRDSECEESSPEAIQHGKGALSCCSDNSGAILSVQDQTSENIEGNEIPKTEKSKELIKHVDENHTVGSVSDGKVFEKELIVPDERDEKILHLPPEEESKGDFKRNEGGHADTNGAEQQKNKEEQQWRSDDGSTEFPILKGSEHGEQVIFSNETIEESIPPLSTETEKRKKNSEVTTRTIESEGCLGITGGSDEVRSLTDEEHREPAKCQIGNKESTVVTDKLDYDTDICKNNKLNETLEILSDVNYNNKVAVDDITVVDKSGDSNVDVEVLESTNINNTEFSQKEDSIDSSEICSSSAVRQDGEVPLRTATAISEQLTPKDSSAFSKQDDPCSQEIFVHNAVTLTGINTKEQLLTAADAAPTTQQTFPLDSDMKAKIATGDADKADSTESKLPSGATEFSSERLTDMESQIHGHEHPLTDEVDKKEGVTVEPQGTMSSPKTAVEVEIKPRYSNFLKTTCHKSLIRSASMEEIVKKMSDGSYLWKIRGVNKYFSRHFKVDKDTMTLVAESKKWWSPGSFTASLASDGGETSVPIIDIVEVREGWKTDAFNKVADYNDKMKNKGTLVHSEPSIEEHCCFSVIHGKGRDVLDLMANSIDERNLWVSGLKYLLQSVQSLHQDRVYDMWLRKKFEAADRDRNGVLNFDEICSLITNLNLKLDKTHARSLFNAANVNKRKKAGDDVLDSQEFVDFYHSLLKMPELENLYAKYCNKETKVMGSDELLSFFRNEQGLQDYQPNQVLSLIHEYELSDLKKHDYLSFDGFYHLSLSDVFSIYNADHQKYVHQDMTQPLSHYYISSSHNTYLTGHQLAGASSVEGYISALKKGCRVVELDLWDGDDGEPIIYHGHTLTTKITLSDVLRDAIKLYAFTASPYPVILSVENHLSINQQVIMVKLFKDILGEKLLTDSVPNDIKALLSPEDLRYKIIIKAKKPQGIEIEDDDEEDDQDTIDYIDSDDPSSKKKHSKPLAPALAEVVNMCEGKKFVSFGSSFESDKCYHFPSLRENKAKSLFESSTDEFMKFTERQIAKIYPMGTRTDSSNLKPYPFWSVGAQVVTLNMQTEDKATFYNNALFRSNGNCGYVLKPDILIGKCPYKPSQPSAGLMRVLRVKIISGQHLPPSEKKNDVVDSYIQMKVRGHPVDKQKQKTKVIKNNGFNPVWNETLELKIAVPDVAIVYFTARDESSYAKDPVLALAAIPFRSICTGYRHIHLTDITGKRLSPAALFVHVTVADH